MGNIRIMFFIFMFLSCDKSVSSFTGASESKDKKSSQKITEIEIATEKEEKAKSDTETVEIEEFEGEIENEEEEPISLLPAPGEICGGWGNTTSIIQGVNSSVWGCAEPTGDCPSDTVVVRTADNNTYTLCVYKGNDPDFTLETANEISKRKSGEICGGARSFGKHTRIGGNDCLYPPNTDQSCDRWGCMDVEANGDAKCPEGTTVITVSTGYPIYYLCILNGIKEKPVTGNICGASSLPDKCENCPAEHMVVSTSMHGDYLCIAGNINDLRDNYSKLWKREE